jgi:uncharacterized protein (TIGR02453 family)
MATATETFTGFRPEAIQFLADLAENNDRAWFQPRKAEYERLLKEPLEALCVALGERFEARGLPLSADPARSPFRIYRDVRFSKDKSPYKTHVAAAFRWIGDERTAERSHEEGGPAGYFHLGSGGRSTPTRAVSTTSSTIRRSWRRSVTSTASGCPACRRGSTSTIPRPSY